MNKSSPAPEDIRALIQKLIQSTPAPFIPTNGEGSTWIVEYPKPCNLEKQYAARPCKS